MSAALLRELRRVVGRSNVLHDYVDLQTYEYDAYGERSLPGAVVFVRSTAEVSSIVKILNREKIPFVPRGYGTNVSGGSLALNGAVVLEMGRMSEVLEIDLPNLCVTVQPGIFTLDISTALAPFGFYYAPDPASMRASSVGGNIAENAGGPHCFKYGVTSNHVLGLEVVLPDGEVVWLGGKNAGSPGLDLRGAFIGCEGTLGIVTAAILRIVRKPETVKTMLGSLRLSRRRGQRGVGHRGRGAYPGNARAHGQDVTIIASRGRPGLRLSPGCRRGAPHRAGRHGGRYGGIRRAGRRHLPRQQRPGSAGGSGRRRAGGALAGAAGDVRGDHPAGAQLHVARRRGAPDHAARDAAARARVGGELWPRGLLRATRR